MLLGTKFCFLKIKILIFGSDVADLKSVTFSISKKSLFGVIAKTLFA